LTLPDASNLNDLMICQIIYSWVNTYDYERILVNIA
jgi:hypothetical protein